MVLGLLCATLLGEPAVSPIGAPSSDTGPATESAPAPAAPPSAPAPAPSPHALPSAFDEAPPSPTARPTPTSKAPRRDRDTGVSSIGGLPSVGSTRLKLDVPPPPGDGVLTGGIWMVGLGGTSMLLGGLALGLDSMGSPTSGGLALGLGAATVAGGGVLIRQGRRRKARYVAWLEGARLRNPAPTGLPLLASGLGLFVAGSAGTAITFAEISNDDVESEGIVPYTIFGAALLSGVTLTGLGLGRHRAYRNWLERQPIEWSPYLSPTSLQPGDQAVVAGAIGRF